MLGQAAERSFVQVSDEMISLIGAGAIDPRRWPAEPVAFAYRFDPPPTLRFHARPAVTIGEDSEAELILVASSFACRRIFGALPDAGSAFHMSAEIRAIARAILDPAIPEPARATLRLAKSIELLCETFRLLGGRSLVPAAARGSLSREDSLRIVEARRMIDENWSEKLTLDTIARACGLNRAKLTRGFRDLFDCTVADALAERRLAAARRMLLSTDLPVSSIGYKCGYLNNASFTRAFVRRFGTAPTRLRAAGAAA